MKNKHNAITSFTLIIDEGISGKQLSRFEAFAKNKRINFCMRLDIAEAHSGMPDTQILHHLLNKQTVFITTDRPFHNKVLSKGLKSYYISDTQIKSNVIPGFTVKPDIPLTKATQEIKSNYHPEKTPLRSLLLPSFEKELKRLSTKRRRIRNHFGGLDNIDQIAVTVSLRRVKTKILVGVRIRVSSCVGMKALDASESYIIEEVETKHSGIAALCHALILVVLLMLHSRKTLVFFDTNVIVLPKKGEAGEGNASDFDNLYFQLCDTFEHIEFVPTPKGEFIDRLRTKLVNLSKIKNNEVKTGNLAEIIRNVKEESKPTFFPQTS